MYKATQKAFTLVELMITLAIVGILVSVAFPSYQGHINTAKESEAQMALSSLANAMNQYRLDNTDLSYAGITAAAIFSDKVPLDGGAKTYTLSILSADATTFKLKATPVDSTLKTYCMDQQGTKDDCAGTYNW
jgi:type IV pilus assembly protein PilE